MDRLKAFLYPCDKIYLAISNQRYFPAELQRQQERQFSEVHLGPYQIYIMKFFCKYNYRLKTCSLVYIKNMLYCR